MITLVPLFDMALTLTRPLNTDGAPSGSRLIGEIASATISGRVTGTLAGSSSADWFTQTSGGLGLPDVRIAIRTDDDALILMRYTGRIRFTPGQESTALIAPLFETGDPRYSWINELQAAGKGIFAADRSHVDYTLFEMR